MTKQERIDFLKEKAIELRTTTLTMIHAAKSGHPGGSLSAADIMSVLYFDVMNVDSKNPKWYERDRFVLSKGHVCPILYSALILRGFMDKEEIYNLRKLGSKLQGHPDMKRTPGVDISTGSLGQGISTAVGMAIGLKREGIDNRVYTIVGDGESNEGQVWEAANAAAKYELDNLVVILDHNRIQNDGFCEDIMPIGCLQTKFEAFGFDTYSCNGHSIEELVDVMDEIKYKREGKPIAIIAHTTKGAGVSFMENVPMWHGVAPSDEELKRALDEVKGGIRL